MITVTPMPYSGLHYQLATLAEKDAHLFRLEQRGRETWVTGRMSRGTLWPQSGREQPSLSFMSETLKRVL